MQNTLDLILLSARNERAFQLGQALALPILLITVGIIFLVRRGKKKAAEAAQKNILD